jgi:hypothetical protein
MENFVKKLVEGELRYELNTFRIVDKNIVLSARDGSMLSIADVPDATPIEIVKSLHKIKGLATSIRDELEKLNKGVTNV